MTFSAVHLSAAALISLVVGFGAGSHVDRLFDDNDSDRLKGMDISTRVTDPGSKFLINVLNDVQAGVSHQYVRTDTGMIVDAKTLIKAASNPIVPEAGCSGAMNSTERLSYDPPRPLATANEPADKVAAGYYSSELLIELDDCFLVVKGEFKVDETGTSALSYFNVSSPGETREDAVRKSIGSNDWREAQAKLRLGKS